ncbi:MAG: putative zinc-binding protein [Chloroflexi bacterium]|nr:putative zinc-binding protein [Chloroflexota bacterium]
MPDLPKKKVGIVACSGEELPEGTVTRLAALKVLEQLRPADTVTICLPLFLAGGEGDRAFARFYPTVAVDGCDKRCAARATEMYSGKPAASVVVSDLVAENGMGQIEGCRRLNDAGQRAVEATAERVADLVDQLLGKPSSQRAEASEPEEAVQATCACGSGIPIQEVAVDGRVVTLIALPLIFQQFHQAGKTPGDGTARELLEVVKIYNPILQEEEEDYAKALRREYAAFSEKEEVPA